MQKEQLHTNTHTCTGFSLVEALLSIAVFALFIAGFSGAYLYGEESTMLAGNRARAVFLAEEGLQAVQSMADESFSELAVGAHGLAISGGTWQLSGASDTTGIFTRVLTISDVSTNRRQVTSTVTWQQNPQRAGTVALSTRFTNWRATSGVSGTCAEFASTQGYSSGVCRQNVQQCTNNGETNLLAGDPYCIASPSNDTCCVLP